MPTQRSKRVRPRSATGRFEQPPAQIETERTAAQGNRNPLLGMLSGSLYMGGGTAPNPCGFPGYCDLYLGTYIVYRWMLQHPILRLARAIRTGPVVASSWECQGRKGTPQAWIDDVKRNMDRLRPELIRDFYRRGCDYGWAGGEMLWEISGTSQYELMRVKPLWWDITEILEDNHGNFTGLKNNARPDPKSGEAYVNLVAPFKAFKYTYDSECDYHYGRSWLENCREIGWKTWLDCAQQIQRLTSKITGVVTLVQSPAGTFMDSNGEEVSFQEAALEVIGGLAGGASGAWYPSLTLEPDSKGQINLVDYIAKLAGKSLTKFEVLDFGKQTGAITPILEQMKHAEELMFAGALRSSRTGLEAQHGTKEEAGVHTDTGTINAEEEDEEFAKGCQPLVNAVLVANHGTRAKDAVVIRAPSLIDRKAQILRAILMACLQEPSVRILMSKSADFDKICNLLDVPQKTPFASDELEVPQEKTDTATASSGSATKNTEPEGGRPTDNSK